MELMKDFKKPINIINLSIAVLSIILAIIFYYQSIMEKVPTYLMPEEHSLIFNSEEAFPSISVMDKDSIRIKENIYLFTSTFWNSGQLPIEPDDVRKQINLILEPCNKILDIKKIEQTHPEISKFNLKETPPLNDTTRGINISWNHFDPNQGVKFQVIYSGKKPSRLYYDGVILGVTNFIDGRRLIGKYKWLKGALVFVLAILYVIGVEIFNKKTNTFYKRILTKHQIKSSFLDFLIFFSIRIIFIFTPVILTGYLIYIFIRNIPSPF